MEAHPLLQCPLEPLLSGTHDKASPEGSIFDAIAAGKELGRKIVQGIHEGTCLHGTGLSARKPSSGVSAFSRLAIDQADVHLCKQEQDGDCRNILAPQHAKTDFAARKHCQNAISFFKSRCELGTPLLAFRGDKAFEEELSFTTERKLMASMYRQGLLSAFSGTLTLAFCIVAVLIPSVRTARTSEQSPEDVQYSHWGSYWWTFIYGLTVTCLCVLGLASLAECMRSWNWGCWHSKTRNTAAGMQKAEQMEVHTHGEKQQFMTYVFHNIRVPFNAIVLGLGHLRSMADKSLLGMHIKESKDLIQMMLDCAESMTTVLDDVTEMGQWEDGASKLNVEEFDLFGLVKFLLWGMKDLLYQKQISFNLSIDPLAKTVLSSNHVLGDKRRILQTLGNFLSNAVKFSPTGGKLELSISCEDVIHSDASKQCDHSVRQDNGTEQVQDTSLCPCLRFGGLRVYPEELTMAKPLSSHFCCSHGSLAKVLITVKDTGNGISPQDQEKLFEPYSFVSSAWVQVAGISGLGLSVAKQFVEQAGGYIGVKSKEGEGTMFYFCLPYPLIPITHSLEVKDLWLNDFMLEERQCLQASPTVHINEQVSKQDTKCTADLPAVDKANKRVLLVEDTEINRVILRKVLQTLQLECEEAVNGQIAVDLLKQGRTYDLILMDKEMPVMDGHEATRQIRLLGIKTPIVALTGNALQSDRKLFLEAGVDDFQTKPLSRDKLVQVLIRFGVEIPA